MERVLYILVTGVLFAALAGMWRQAWDDKPRGVSEWAWVVVWTCLALAAALLFAGAIGGGVMELAE